MKKVTMKRLKNPLWIGDKLACQCRKGCTAIDDYAYGICNKCGYYLNPHGVCHKCKWTTE